MTDPPEESSVSNPGTDPRLIASSNPERVPRKRRAKQSQWRSECKRRLRISPIPASEKISIQESERRRLAQELHDGLGQTLALIRNTALLAVDGAPESEGGPDRLERIAELAGAALREMRRICYGLMPAGLTSMGLAGVLEEMLHEVGSTIDVKLEFDWNDAYAKLCPECEKCVYRIVQEAVTNVVKHAHAHKARVTADQEGNCFVIRISDDGRGFDPKKVSHSTSAPGGLGLESIRDRVRLLNGDLTLESTPGAGAQLILKTPRPCEREMAHSAGESRVGGPLPAIQKEG